MGGLLGGSAASATAHLAPSERSIPIPSNRNLRKFGRDFLVAALGFVALWVGANYTTLELNEQTVAIGTPIALFLYRQARKALGMESA